MKSEEERDREGGGLIEVKGPYGSTRRLTCATATAATAADVEEAAAAVPVASLTATVTTAADVEEADVEEAAVPVASLTATTTVTTAAAADVEEEAGAVRVGDNKDLSSINDDDNNNDEEEDDDDGTAVKVRSCPCLSLD